MFILINGAFGIGKSTVTRDEIRYLDEIRSGLTRSGGSVLHFCLTAPIAIVLERLSGRGERPSDSRWSWVHRRAAECCAAHQADMFATHVATDSRTPAAIASELAARIRHATQRIASPSC